MNDLVGIIRRGSEIEEALEILDKLRDRVANVRSEGGTIYNPGWHLALDLRNMLLVSESIARAALEREESRGGHTRDDFPDMSPEWRKVNLVVSLRDGRVRLRQRAVDPLRPDLLELFEHEELTKYLTKDELAADATAKEEL